MVGILKKMFNHNLEKQHKIFKVFSSSKTLQFTHEVGTNSLIERYVHCWSGWSFCFCLFGLLVSLFNWWNDDAVQGKALGQAEDNVQGGGRWFSGGRLMWCGIHLPGVHAEWSAAKKIQEDGVITLTFLLYGNIWFSWRWISWALDGQHIQQRIFL